MTAGISSGHVFESDSAEHQAAGSIVYLAALAGISVALHIVANITGAYGYFRDELYYLACAEHPAFGYVDQAPLSIYLLGVSRALFGDSLVALRILPSLLSGVTVFLTGLIARAMGGSRFAQVISALASFVSLVFLGMFSFYSMNATDIVFWTLAAYFVVLLAAAPTPRRWTMLGVVLGLGLMNKIGVLWYGAGIAIGVLLTPALRRELKTPWPWVAAIVAALLFLPYPVWNYLHDFATAEFIRNATADKYRGLTGWTFIRGQFEIQNPSTIFLWIPGLVFLFLRGAGQRYRIVGIAYLAVFAILVINGHSKAEYLSAAYPPLFAAGGVAVERLSAARLRWLRPAMVVLVLTGLGLAPLALPILPVETYIRYAEAIGQEQQSPEGKKLGRLPQFYADMFGWREKAEAVAGVFAALPPEERRECALYGENYGRSAAIDFFGPQYGLPKSIGSHNNYWIWGTRGYTGSVVIVLGGNRRDLSRRFERVDSAAAVHSRYCMPYENDLTVFVCRNLREPLGQIWGAIKNYQ